MRFTIVLLMTILTSTVAAAPLEKVYDPVTGDVELISEYEYDEIDFLLRRSPSFRRWNDMENVCAAVTAQFGQTISACLPEPLVMESRDTARVTIIILSTETAPEEIVHVAPVYSADSSTYRPWA